MQHVRDLKTLHLAACALTIGSFDGVHRGHQALVRKLVTDAQERGIPAVVLTFYPHPSVVLRGRRPAFYITSPDEKAQLLEALGVEIVITHEFNTELSEIRATAFLDLLEEHLGVRQLVIGENFALGHQREGNRFFLEQVSEERGFKVHVFPPVSVGGEIVSSTRVREALRSGDVARAARYLGRPFRIPGRVIAGARRGKSLGFPTANLEIWDERAYPGAGVYACYAEIGPDRWDAVTNIGFRPTFDERTETLTIETHLLDFSGDLYDSEVRLAFIERLRDERRFPDPPSLLAQIERDIRNAREILQSDSDKRGGDDRST